MAEPVAAGRVALAQVAATAEPGRNLDAALDLMGDAARRGARLLVFPELSFLRFFPQQRGRREPFELAESIPGPATQRVARRAAELGMVTIVNLFEKSGSRYYDSSPVIDADGSLQGVVRMQHLAEEPGFHEQGYYAAPAAETPRIFDTAAGRIGVAICYDRHFASVMTGLALAGADVVCVPQAGATSDPLDLYEIEMRAASFQHGYQVALANRVGREEVLTFAGRSFVTDPDGNVLARGAAGTPDLVLADLDPAGVQAARRRRPFLRDLRRDLFRHLHG